jgi:HAD superfamily hydrolase (TIGR01549 family)
MFKLIIFDLDGTLVDSSKLSKMTFYEVVSRFGYDPSLYWDTYRKTSGLPLEEQLRRTIPALVDKKDEYLRLYLEVHKTFIKKAVEKYLGIDEMLRKITIPKAIFTAKNGTSANVIIKDILQVDFDYISTHEMRKFHKPNPEPLLDICQRFNVKPEEALYVGDGIHDIECAKNAGVASMAITWGQYYTVEELKSLKPDYIVDKPEEILDILNRTSDKISEMS